MIKKFFGTAIIALVTMPSLFAQVDSTKTLVFSGSVDAYYRYNFANVDDGFNSNNYTSFTNSQASFALGMASIRADATALSGKLTATADLGFGPRAQEFSYSEATNSTTLAMVKQMFITYAVSDKVKLTAGKFATHIGYEVVDPFLNKNYSMSYMFTNGPFTHTGIKADITAGPIGLMFGIANYIDQSISTTSVKTVLGQISGGSKNGKTKVYLNYAGFYGSNEGMNPSGLKAFTQLDLVLTSAISDKFNLGFNATMQDRTQPAGTGDPSGAWWGAAAYLNVTPTPVVTLTLRSEYIGDSKMVYYSTKNIFANTLSLNYQVGPVTIIPEFRFEFAGDDFYTKHDGDGQSSTGTFLMAAVYHF
jgi:hypothetical protein